MGHVPGAEFQIDPTTRDYSLDAEGQPVVTNSVLQAAYIRLSAERGRWMHDTALGSRYHELATVRGDADADRRVEDFAREALEPLRQEGRAEFIEVRTIERVRFGRQIEVKIRDKVRDLVIPLELLIPVG